MNNKTAIILFNLGGPDKLTSVKPFLFNLFNDRAIINLPQPWRFFLAKFISNRREKKAQKIYSQIGGRSPILDITSSQAHFLEKELSFFGDFKVFVAMRYWKPFIKNILPEILEYGAQKIILLPLYPQFSTTTTGSFFKEFEKEFTQLQSKIMVEKICCYYDNPLFIRTHSDLIKNEILKNNLQLQNCRLLFSAHGLPQKIIDAGDPYVTQIESSSKKIIENLQQDFGEKNIDFKVCYQSKVGPMEWTKPSLEHEIRRVAIDKKIPLIIPISFVSDHSETLVELDIEYKELSHRLGITKYIRVPSLNIKRNFIQLLVELVKNNSNNIRKKCCNFNEYCCLN